jgi:hypothetical protein
MQTQRSGGRWILSLLLCGAIAAVALPAAAAEEKAVGGLGLSGPAADAAPEGELQLPATPEKGIVRLTIKTDNPQIQLKRNVATIMTSQTTGVLIQDLICRAPCGAVVDGRKGEQFFFGGMNVIASDSFQLIDYSGNVEATVKEGSHGAFWGAVWGITLGVCAAVGGLTWAALGDVKWGLITGAVGVGMTVGGWVLYSKAGKTTVEFRPLSSP